MKEGYEPAVWAESTLAEHPSPSPVTNHRSTVSTPPGPSAVEPRLSANRWRIGLVVGWIVVLAVLSTPFPLAFPGPNLDTLWGAAMNEAYVHRLTWGTQIIWTYGPYGFLDSTYYYYGSNWIWSFAAAVGTNVAFIVALALFLSNLRATWWMWLTVGLALLLPVRFVLGVDVDLALTAMLLLHLAVTGRWRFATLFAIPAGFCVALALLVKGNYAAAGVGVTVCFIAVALLMRRWTAIGFFVVAAIVSLVGLWVPTAPLWDLPAYLRSMYDITTGYTAAMSVFIEQTTISARYARLELVIAALILGAAALTVVLTAVRRDLRGLSLALLSAPILFVTYKEVFVRYGPGRLPVLYGVVVLVTLPLLIQVVVSRTGRPRLSWPTRLVPACSLVLCLLLLAGLGSVQLQTPVEPNPLLDTQARLQAYPQAAQLATDPSLQSEMNARTAAQFRAPYHFTPHFLSELRQGTFDAFPIDAALAYAYHLDWDPRPLFQSYQGNTPFLDQADAAHYLSRDGPHHVLFSLFDMDGRYGLFDEPATLRALVDCYRVVDSDGGFLLLQRRAASCTEPPLHRLNTVVAPLGTYVPVPRTAGRVYADVQVRYNLLGRLADFVYRPSELHVQFHYGPGTTSPEFRYVAAVGVDGLLVSSYVSQITDFQHVMVDQPTVPIDALRILAGTREYDPHVTVTFYTDSTT